MEQTRRLRKKEQTRLALMHSAKILFEQNGIGNVTIEQITEGADVSRSTFFSYFESVDDLLSQIADGEINDIFSAVEKAEGALSVAAVFRQLSADTYNYPSLTAELFTRSILAPGKSAAARVDGLLQTEIARDVGENLPEGFTAKDISAFIFGAYFGLVFQKLMNDEPFEKPAETNDKIQKLISFFKTKEANP
ncbi:MAG: TetR/AcrR family transcriptional regulator [Clostridia bacterium]|nr:TetR/AcrR family transcriptional regulator [Clostridia bacterium]